MTEASSEIDDVLAAMAQRGSSEAEEVLITRYIPLVRRVARPYFLTGGDSEDLIQEGMMGLLSAVRHYSPERGAAFKTYAELCIRRRIYSVIRKFASSVVFHESHNTRTNSWVDLINESRNPEELLIAKERNSEFLGYFFSDLSKLELNILRMYLKGCAYSEIAKETGKSTKSVDNAIQRVRRKLRSAQTRG